MSDTIIVVPCYNEESRLDLTPFVQHAQRFSRTRFLFVDDGSSDDTSDLILTAGVARTEQIDLLTMPQNMGKAEAVRHGFQEAFSSAPRFVGFWDADLATPLDAIPEFQSVLEGSCDLDMVFGARVQLLGRSIERHMWRHYVGRVFATAVSMVLRLPVYDTQCGAKLFRNDGRLVEAFETPFLARWVFDVEIIARYMNMHRRDHRPAVEGCIYELPLDHWEDVAGSKLKPSDFLTAALDLAHIAWTYQLSPALADPHAWPAKG